MADRSCAPAGADLIDLGCDPGDAWSGVGPAVRALVDAGHRVSIDSMNTIEIAAAVRAGAELVLSVNSSNRDAAADWGCPVVVVPDLPATLAGLDETIEHLAGAKVRLRIDPILEPIGCGFAASLGRYLDVRRRYPDAEMLMGIGNLTELTDADSAAINVLLLGICQELSIRSVLTTEVINWARSSVRECDLARRLVYFAVRHRLPPKRLDTALVMLRDAVVPEFGKEYLEKLAREIRDRNYRLFAEGDKVHAVTAGGHWSESDPFLLFEQMAAAAEKPIDANHAFYLGYEMAKAATALTLGKDYRQDEALDWGFLTRPEESHRRGPRSHEARGKSDDRGGRVGMSRPLHDRDSSGLPVGRAAGDGMPGARGGVFAFGAPATRAVSRQRAARAGAGALFVSGGRSVRFYDRAGGIALRSHGHAARSTCDLLAERLARVPRRDGAGLPPFQGGAAGLWSYDLNRSLEWIAPPRLTNSLCRPWPSGCTTSCWPSITHRAKPGSSRRDFPNASRRRGDDGPNARRKEFAVVAGRAASGRCRPVTEPMRRARCRPTGAPPLCDDGPARIAQQFFGRRLCSHGRAGDRIHPRRRRLSSKPFAAAVVAGSRKHAVALYLRLRQCNPAPFAGYFDLGQFQIVSASPERFLQVSGGEVETRPIKGTRQRTRRPEADLFAGDELAQSEKDRAENVMIVDLMRNDLAKVCQADSVRLTQLCQLDSYAFVQHLVSAVRGTLRPGLGPLDLLRATFPGGSISGAPKVRAMEIIAELEPTARGAYCGALGYVGFDGSADTNLLIRTITAGRGWWQAPVGGGIVAQSHPQREYEETWHKAAAKLLRAFGLRMRGDRATKTMQATEKNRRPPTRPRGQQLNSCSLTSGACSLRACEKTNDLAHRQLR